MNEQMNEWTNKINNVLFSFALWSEVRFCVDVRKFPDPSARATPLPDAAGRTQLGAPVVRVAWRRCARTVGFSAWPYALDYTLLHINANPWIVWKEAAGCSQHIHTQKKASITHLLRANPKPQASEFAVVSRHQHQQLRSCSRVRRSSIRVRVLAHRTRTAIDLGSYQYEKDKN